MKERRSWFAEVENRVFFVLEWGRGIRKPILPHWFMGENPQSLTSRAEEEIWNPDLL